MIAAPAQRPGTLPLSGSPYVCQMMRPVCASSATKSPRKMRCASGTFSRDETPT